MLMGSSWLTERHEARVLCRWWSRARFHQPQNDFLRTSLSIRGCIIVRLHCLSSCSVSRSSCKRCCLSLSLSECSSSAVLCAFAVLADLSNLCNSDKQSQPRTTSTGVDCVVPSRFGIWWRSTLHPAAHISTHVNLSSAVSARYSTHAVHIYTHMNINETTCTY